MFGLKRLEISHADGVVHLPQPSGPEAFNSQNVFFLWICFKRYTPQKKRKACGRNSPKHTRIMDSLSLSPSLSPQSLIEARPNPDGEKDGQYGPMAIRGFHLCKCRAADVC